MSQKLFILIIFFGCYITSSGQTSPLLLNKCWEFNTSNMTKARIASDNNTNIIIPQNNSKIIALNKIGQIIWTSDIAGDLQSEIFIIGKVIYFITQNTDSKNIILFQGISLETGIGVLRKEIKSEVPVESVKLQKFAEDLLLFLNDDSLLLFDVEEGIFKINDQLKVKVSSNISLLGESLFFANKENQVMEYLVDVKKPKLLFQSVSSVSNVYADQNGFLLIGDVLGRVVQFDKITGKKKWTFRAGAEINSVIETKDFYLLTSLDNYIYFISVKKGKLLWKKRMEGRTESNFVNQKSQIISSFINGQTTLIVDSDKGRTSNQVVVDESSFFVNEPVILGDLLLLTTNRSLLAYSFADCPK